MRAYSLFHVREVAEWQGVTRRNTSVWLASLLILTGSAQLALAIGPDYQVMPSSSVAGTPVSAVVDFLSNPTANSDFGTGEIFYKYASNGVDYAEILTADHVGSAGSAGYNAFVAIGANNGSAGANIFQEQFLPGAPVSATISNGIGGPTATSNFEDLDIMQVNLGPVVTTSNLFNSIVPMNILNPALYPATLLTNALPQYTTFTQYGYGYAGLAVVGSAGGSTPGYASYDKPFNLRFQDNNVTSVNTTYTSPFNATNFSQNANNPYSEPLVHYSTMAPPNLQLQGGGLQGDSGGPFDYLSSASVTVTNNSNVAINGVIYTDGQFAVFVGGHDTGTNYTATNFTPPGGTTTVSTSLAGNDQYGVYITQANYNWIISEEVPEPSSDLLVLIGGCVLAGFARRSYRRKA
jgi:hypothetical protein